MSKRAVRVEPMSEEEFAKVRLSLADASYYIGKVSQAVSEQRVSLKDRVAPQVCTCLYLAVKHLLIARLTEYGVCHDVKNSSVTDLAISCIGIPDFLGSNTLDCILQIEHMYQTDKNLVEWDVIGRYLLIFERIIEEIEEITPREYELLKTHTPVGNLNRIHDDKNVKVQQLTFILQKYLDVEEIIIFGSAVKGECTNTSNICVYLKGVKAIPLGMYFAVHSIGGVYLVPDCVLSKQLMDSVKGGVIVYKRGTKHRWKDIVWIE